MNLTDFIRQNIRQMQGYVPGMQKNEAEVLKLNSNENPFPPSKGVIEALHKAVEEEALQKYPDSKAAELRAAIARRYGCQKEQILIGNGSDEILGLIFRAFLGKNDSIVVPDPTYSLYPVLAQMIPCELVRVPLRPDWKMDFAALAEKSQDARLVILALPNAPTGIWEDPADIRNFLGKCKCPVLVDEAYADFARASWVSAVGAEEFANLMVCGTFSKSYSLAGLRVGWLAAPKEAIAEIDKIRDSYNVNRLSQRAALAALEDQSTFASRISEVIENRAFLQKGLETLGFVVLPSSANFLMARPEKEGNSSSGLAQSCYDFLQKKNILIRYFSEARLSSWLRISIGTKEEMEQLLLALREWRESLE